MNFIDAVIAIEKHPTLELCPNGEERSGQHSICVYQNGEFIGKLRWPLWSFDESVKLYRLVAPGEVDEAVEEALGV